VAIGQLALDGRLDLRHIFSTVMAATLLWLHYKDPALLAERFRRPGTGGESRSDLAILVGIKVACIAWVVLPPLDVRFGWTPHLQLWSEVPGAVLFFVGSLFFLLPRVHRQPVSLATRTYPGGARATRDRYGRLRGGAPSDVPRSKPLVRRRCVAARFSLGVLVGLATVLLLFIRIFGEEKLLVHDLVSYKAYREKVRYGLVPGVW
jgi:protein-S-isoprenylcysteine O-methyltransferase Ste14